MFNKGIYSTTLTSVPADRLFSNITSGSISNALDQSFLSTLRVLLHKRIPQNETFQLTCTRLHYPASAITEATATQSMLLFTENLPRFTAGSEYGIHIIYAGYSDVGEKMLEIIRANDGVSRNSRPSRNPLHNYLRRNDLHVFYARKANALFYTTEDGKHTVIFTDKLELKHFHALQMMIPKYLPRLFEGNFFGSNSTDGINNSGVTGSSGNPNGANSVGNSSNSNYPNNSGDINSTHNSNPNYIPLTDAEASLLKSLGNKSAVEYEALIEEFAKAFDIRSEIIRSKLAGFETAFEKFRISELKNEIQTHQDSYDFHAGQMREMANKMQECRYTLAGLMSAVKESSGDTDLMEYFMCNKNLVIIKVTGTAIELVVNGYADVYDVDAFEQYVSNHQGFMYTTINPAITKPQMEKLYRAIFGAGGGTSNAVRSGVNNGVDNNSGNDAGGRVANGSINGDIRFKLRICAAYVADMRNGLRGIKGYTFPNESRTHFPNPHIQSHGCIGTYSGRFQEYMVRKDYVGAIAQVAVSARNLNFYDSAVMGGFAKSLSMSNSSCIEGADGTLYTPLEAIAELEKSTAIVAEEGDVCQDQN